MLHRPHSHSTCDRHHHHNAITSYSIPHTTYSRQDTFLFPQFRNSSKSWQVFAIRRGVRSRSFWRTVAARIFHGTMYGWNRCLNCAIRFHYYFALERASNEAIWYHIQTGWQPHVVRIHLLWIGDVVYGHLANCSLHSGPIASMLFRRTFQGSEGCSRNHGRDGTSHIRGGFG